MTIEVFRSLGPLSRHIADLPWPVDFFSPEDLPKFLDKIFVLDYRLDYRDDGFSCRFWLGFEGELSVALPGLNGVKLVAGGGDAAGATFATVSLIVGQESSLTLENFRLSIRFDPTLLKPAAINDGDPVPQFAEIRVEGSLRLDLSSFDLSVVGFDAFTLTPVMIGNSGIIMSASDVKLDLSRTHAIPEVIAAGFDDSFIGVYIGEATVKLPDDFPSLAPADLVLKKCVIGSGGVSGRLEAHYFPTYDEETETFTGNGAGTLFGIPFGLKDIDLEFKQNTFKKSEIKGEMLLPFFNEPVEVDIGISLDGDFTVALTSTGSNGLKKLIKPKVLEIELDSIGFELKDGVFLVKLSGELTPLFGADKGLKWPGFKVEELSIDSKGNVLLKGGWLALPKQQYLDFHGFKIGITKIGFGKTEDGGKWVGFCGELKLVDGFPAGASVEGLRVTWYPGDPSKTKITIEGVGVEFEIPNVLYFKGHVAYQELEGVNGTVHRFVGDIKMKLNALKMDIDAKLIIGSASGGPEGTYTFFAIYLAAEWPGGIPITATPLALYGIDGLFALQMAPNKTESEEWYDGWYKRDEIGVTDLEKKWVNRRGSFALGGGVTIGTAADNGFTFACKALLVFAFPGPTVLLVGKANLLKERARLNDDPTFRALAVLDMHKEQILIGLDAQYKRDWQTGRVVHIRAGAEAFFHKPDDWHIYLGQKETRDKRMRARVLSLFDADAYFMIEPKWLKTGIWVGYARQWKFGPVGLTLEAWIEANVVVNWTPLHFRGDLWLHGNVEIKVFGFGLGLSVDARFEADVFDPFHVKASIEVSIKLPKPLKKKHVKINLEWGPIPDWPKQLPLPLKEVAIEHFKVTTSWPLPKDSTPPLLVPRYDSDQEGLRGYYEPPQPLNAPPLSAMPVVPVDGRAHLSFGRPVHDDALVGVNPQPVQPAEERIGDPEKNAGPVRVRYGLKEIELAKWDQQTNLWRPVASKPAVSGVPTLYGSWAAVPQLPSGAGLAPVANVKLWLWSKTPFDYTRHGGSDWDNWFIANFPNYPCVPQDVPDREVCFDFETLDSSQWLQSPWQVPQHPEITLGWQSPPRQHVTTLDPPVDGFTHALSFPAVVSTCLPPPPADLSPPVLTNTTAQPGSAPTQPNTVTIKLSRPAKQVKLWVLEGKTDQVCLNFRNRERAKVDLPHVEQGVNFGPAGTTTIEPIPTTLGDMMGLICGVPTLVTLGSLTITLPCPARAVELMLTYQPSPGLVIQPKIEAFDSAGTKVAEKSMINPAGQPEIVRFEGSDLKSLRINSGTVRAYLHELCFLCPDNSSSVTATALDAEGKQIGVFVNQGNVIEIRGKDLSSVQVNSNHDIRLLKICTLFGPDPKEVAHRQEMEKHLQTEVARWSMAGEVLEPFSAYQLKIVTTIDAVGEHPLSSSKNLTQTEYAYFRTEGPPGLTKLSLPAGRDPAKDADKFDSGLDDLTRYVRQTMPATIPKVGEKPVMAKPFYRAYDIGIEFNEDYVDLMYRISGRDLGLYIYDSNNRPARDVDGRLLVQSGDWGAVEELTLTEGEQRWLALSNSENRCLPVISTETIAHDKKLTSAVAGRVLEPDMIHEARLVPLLLREGFQKYAAGATAPGPSGKLGRWEVRDEGNVNSPSHWVVNETVAPVGKYITQTSSIKGGNVDANDPAKPGTILLFTDDPELDSGHREQPTNWTDYRLSIYLSAAGGGAMGLVFRVRDGNNYYRFSMDRIRNYRRIVTVTDGIHNILKQDAFAYELQQDYLITIEAIGDTLRIYQDGALIFDVTDESHRNGSIGLYCYDNAGARFNDVRVEDFRQTAPVVYRFQFTTSQFANFFHHLHSYQDETWRVAVENVPAAYPAMSKAVPPATLLTDEEARAYETLATTVLGPAARQNPPGVQLTRVEIDGVPLGFLLQSPEPIDWLRTEMALSRTSFVRTEPALPARVKLAGVHFAPNRVDIESVVLLLREPMDLSAYRIEGRLVAWPLSPGDGVVIDARTLTGGELGAQPWATYRTFEAEKNRSAGTILKVQPGGPLSITLAGLAGVDAAGVHPAHRILYSIELRLMAPDGKIVHSRHFLPDDDYVFEHLKVLRKADGTGCFMIKLDVALNAIPLSLEQYRLKLTYHRNNRTRVPTSQIWSQAGNDADEIVTLDIPLQTQN